MPRHVRKPAPKPRVASKLKRRMLHALWPSLVMGPVVTARNELDVAMRHYKDGLTEKEYKYLEQRRQELMDMHEDLLKIYFRLKF
jgi:hypothetical protein